jgi:hypothetical protein
MLSGTAVATLSGDADCASSTQEISLLRLSGSVTFNGQPQNASPYGNLYFNVGPPYQLDVAFTTGELAGTVTADHVTGPMLHAHLAGTLTDSAGNAAHISMTVACSGLPASAIKGSS